MMLFKWFYDNQMKSILSKCHPLVNKNDEEVTIRIGDTETKNSEYEKLLSIKVDTKLNFNEHLNDIISKADRKVNALSRVMPYMSLSKKKTQPAFTCSKLTIETIEQGVKCVQS